VTLASRRSACGAAVLAGLLVTAELLSAQVPVAGTWNLQTGNIAMRASGGVRNVLLKVEEVDGGLRAQMTSPRNTFLDVTSFELDGSRMVVTFGAYVYDLDVSGNQVTGTMVSPVDTLLVDGRRQEGLMFGGDDPARYVMTRTGPLGHRTELLPPEDVADPGEWVRSRAQSVEDLVLVLRGGIPVSFTNAPDFADELMMYAGQRIDVTGEWIGDRYQIHDVALAGPPRR